MVETVHQVSEVSSFCNRERGQPPFIKITLLTLLLKKSTIRLSNTQKNLKSNLVFVVVIVLNSKGVCCYCWTTAARLGWQNSTAARSCPIYVSFYFLRTYQQAFYAKMTSTFCCCQVNIHGKSMVLAQTETNCSHK